MDQSIDNPPFKAQVDWELNHLGDADVVAFYFDPKGKAPVTLLELGLNLRTGKACVVYCPEGYWRRANVEIVTKRYGGKWCETEEEFVKELRIAIWEKGHSARFRK